VDDDNSLIFLRPKEANLEEVDADAVGAPTNIVMPFAVSKTSTGFRKAWRMSSSLSPCFRAVGPIIGSTLTR
jgi:hypothetical protein